MQAVQPVIAVRRVARQAILVVDQLEGPDLDHILVLQRAGPLQAPAVEERAVGAAEVGQLVAGRGLIDARMASRDRRVIEVDPVGGVAPQGVGFEAGQLPLVIEADGLAARGFGQLGAEGDRNRVAVLVADADDVAVLELHGRVGLQAAAVDAGAVHAAEVGQPVACVALVDLGMQPRDGIVVHDDLVGGIAADAAARPLDRDGGLCLAWLLDHQARARRGDRNRQFLRPDRVPAGRTKTSALIWESCLAELALASHGRSSLQPPGQGPAAS